MSSTSPTPSTLERRCHRLFSRLHQLVNIVKSHDHHTDHFNIENALLFIQTQDIESKFKNRAAERGNGGAECKLAERSLRDCVLNLDACLETCQKMGTPDWASSSDMSLSVSWTLFVANFKNASHLLDLPEFNLLAFHGVQSTPQTETSAIHPGMIRRDSLNSMTSSQADTIEPWEQRHNRRESERLVELRLGREGLGVTATGTRFQTLPARLRAKSVRSVSTCATASRPNGGLQPPPLPPRSRDQSPSNKSVEAIDLTPLIPSEPPPAYSPGVQHEIIPDIKPTIDPATDWDAKTTVPTNQRPQSEPKPQVIPPAAPDPRIDMSLPNGGHFHFHGSGNTFNINTAPFQTHMQSPSNPWPYPYPYQARSPALIYPAGPPMGYQQNPVAGYPQSPITGFPPVYPAPQGPSRLLSYKPSGVSLRETAALHLRRHGAPSMTLHALKPETTCEHGVVHFKQHTYCGWNNCCARRGCGGHR